MSFRVVGSIHPPKQIGKRTNLVRIQGEGQWLRLMLQYYFYCVEIEKSGIINSSIISIGVILMGKKYVYLFREGKASMRVTC